MKKVQPKLKAGIDTRKVIGALAIVALAGIAAGLLLAPESGTKTRGKIKDKLKDLAQELMDKMKAEAKMLQLKAVELAKDGLENASQRVHQKAEDLHLHN